MKLVITMELDDAAVQENGMSEVRRMLNDACDRLPESSGYWVRGASVNLIDYNGNRVGTAAIEE